MARIRKSIEAKTGNLTKKERELQQEGESKIKAALNTIKAPEWLSTAQKRRFKWYVKQMDELNILTMLDAEYLAKYIYYETRFLEYDGLIRQQGFIIDGKAHPLIVEQRLTKQLMEKMETKLGFNPSDRLRFALPEEEKVNELEAFINEL